MDVRGFPTSLPEFQQVFPNEAACAAFLEAVRWPSGFTCKTCNHQGDPFRFNTRTSIVLRCRKCMKNTSLTAGTVMQKTHMPLSIWFWGAYLMTTQTPGQSALQFQRQLGIRRYETAFAILHKLRSGMVRPERDRIGKDHPVEVDECFVGGNMRGEGRGVHHKVTVIGAVEVRQRKDGEARSAKWKDSHDGGIPLKKLIYAGRLRLQVISDRTANSIIPFIDKNVEPGASIRSDGWDAYNSLSTMGYDHRPLVLDGDHEKIEAHQPMIHLVFSNLKTWILGTHHGRIESRHLQAYLNEYVFRFNRRFYPMTAFNSVLGLVARVVPPTYAQLYSGDWNHPGNTA
jgi:transposase-like protein